MSNEQQKKTVRGLLNEYKVELQGEVAETDATKELAKDIEAMVKEYDGISAIVTKYQAAHQNAFKEEKCKVEKQWEDEAQDWEKVLDNDIDLKNTITNLAKCYCTKADTIRSERDTASSDFNSIKSNLEKAKSEESDALKVFNKSKEFEKKVKEYFTDFDNLIKEGKEYKAVGNLRLVYALFLEIEVVWMNIRNLYVLIEGSPPRPPRTPDWLLKKLNAELREVIMEKHEKYLAHKEWLKKEKAATTAQENYNSFIENNNRRKEFMREAQDVEPGSCCSGTSGGGSSAAA